MPIDDCNCCVTIRGVRHVSEINEKTMPMLPVADGQPEDGHEDDEDDDDNEEDETGDAGGGNLTTPVCVVCFAPRVGSRFRLRRRRRAAPRGIVVARRQRSGVPRRSVQARLGGKRARLALASGALVVGLLPVACLLPGGGQPERS